jgi:transposase
MPPLRQGLAKEEWDMVVVGVDAHTRQHSAAAVDEVGRVLDRNTVGAGPRELDRLLGWIQSFPNERLVAVEGARGLGLPLVRKLLAAGEAVVDVPSVLTSGSRRQTGRLGKDDDIDAVAVARIALRDPDLLRLNADVLNADLKLLVDARDQLVQEATRVRNRLHALLLALSPGYRDVTGPLNSDAALHVAARLTGRARKSDPIRVQLARAAIRRLRALDRDAAELEKQITATLEALAPKNLLAVCGVGPLVAAKILGETHDVRRFRSRAAFASYAGTAPIPASSGVVVRHRLNPSGNRQLNRALYSVALTQARCDARAREYLAKKQAEGKSRPEAQRALKRHLANSVYQALRKDAAARTLDSSATLT